MKRTGLRVEHLNITHQENNEVLVHDLNLSLEPAKSLTLLGQSGSGKTMICRAVLGLLNRRIFSMDGSITFDHANLLQLKERERSRYFGSRIAFIPQNPMTALDPSRKIGHQMTAFLRMHQRISRKESAGIYGAALKHAGLPETDRVLGSFPSQLSGGMLQRALIALALASEAELVIADEPTTALDVLHREQAVEGLLHMNRHGCAVLLVTHDFEVARRMGGDVLVLHEGESIEWGPVEKVLHAPQAGYTKALIAATHLDLRGDCFAGHGKSV